MRLHSATIHSFSANEGFTYLLCLDGSGVSAECKVVVKPRLVQSLSLNATQKELIIGDAFLLTATAMPENATNQSVVWKLVSGDAITLSADGVIQAKKVGEALVRAEAAESATASPLTSFQTKLRLVAFSGESVAVSVKASPTMRSF